VIGGLLAFIVTSQRGSRARQRDLAEELLVAGEGPGATV
jgi:hypothetical protein